MLRFTRLGRCVAHDVRTGVPSDYRPRFRPRRLVMPVDTWDMKNPKRNDDPLFLAHQTRKTLLRTVKKRGALKLSTVPEERTAADAVRIALENATRSGFTDPDGLVPPHAADLLKQVRAAEAEGDASTATSHQQAQSSSPDADIVTIGTSDERSREVSHRTLRVWELLEKTSMSAPAHGVLALKGKSLVECELLEHLYAAYPRMRSQHAQRLVHQCTGLLSIGRIATRVGLVDLYGVHTEVGLWREINTLKDRFRKARKMATVHKQRLQEGIAQQRRWYWRGVLTSAGRKLAKLPVTAEQLQPRMEWLRHQVFQWIACVEAMEGATVAKTLVMRLFCSQLGKHRHVVGLLERATRLLDTPKEVVPLASREALKREMRVVERHHLVDSDTDGGEHPLNNRQLQKREQFNSSFGAHAMQPLKDDVVDEYRTERMRHLAPPLITHLIDPQNAFREMQIVLRYDPFVPVARRTAPIDVDLVIRNMVEVHETNQHNSLSFHQQYRQVQYHVAKVFAGTECIGEGKGETDMIAIQEASIHSLLNYYLRRQSTVDQQCVGQGKERQQSPDEETSSMASVSVDCTAAQNGAVDDTPALRSVAEETSFFF